MQTRTLGLPRVRQTMRVFDSGRAPRFQVFFLALSFSRFDGESTLPPTGSLAFHLKTGFSTVSLGGS